MLRIFLSKTQYENSNHFFIGIFLCSQANLFAQENRLNKEGEMEGRWEEYFKNGKLAGTGVYKNGKKEGQESWYWKNGNINKKGIYKNNKQERE